MTSDRPVVLVVDDKRNMVRLMSKVLRDDAQVLTAESGTEALGFIDREPIDVVLSDLEMPDMSGLDVLRACTARRPDAAFILMTAYATVGTAVEALKLGAYDYLQKPFDPEDARAVVLRALGQRAASSEGVTEILPGTRARSPLMRELGDLVGRIAASAATTLIIGETGTGKERIARGVHRLSPRADQRFVAVNCAAIPADLLESELFGFTRGAFTGAARDRAGLFEEADGGTLFLDEIGEMRLSLQAKLTRALEERAIRRIGDSRERRTDVRIVAATHRDLEAMVRNGAFREDLWYRLNVAVVHVPPLRDRREDIELLAQEFLRDIAPSIPGRRILGITPAAMTAIESYDWPGNVRQLRAAIERACVVARGERVEVADLPPEIRARTRPATDATYADLTWAEAWERGRREVGRAYLQALLTRYAGNVVDASAHAGVERESFYRLMRRFGVEADTFR